MAKDKPQSLDSIPSRLGVLPVRITQYQESKPCDSCHRLSANGMEFYLENYFKDKLTHRFPRAVIDLAAPHNGLLQSQKLDLMLALDSVDLPWAKWFSEPADSNEGLIYRPRDWMTSASAKKRMDRLGGILNQDYLLWPTEVDIQVRPLISNGHTGGFRLDFALVFWNVAKSAPEWVFKYSGESKFMDLDKSLDAHFDRAFGSAWDGLLAEFIRQAHSEPR